jgi:uncharacterized protein YukE
MTDITELALLVSKAKASVFTLEYISQFEPADIDSDDVDLRFEVDGRDTGTNVSIVDECGQAAKVIGTLVEALEKAQQRIAELEDAEQKLCAANVTLDARAELAERQLAAMDSEPVENHIGSKNALDAIVSFIKSKSNPTVKCYEGVSEQLFKDNCHGIHSHVIEYILKLGEELEDLRAEQDEMQPAPVVPDGYVMVPKEPTEEMLQASYREAAVYSPTAYRAMIAAAPQEGKQ